ncbi:hypothetical protein BHM03_00049381 [Ensete ventricosum]|nr:hypothetical protein BHM03_00049381 [Ensete ventricosum]
MRHASTGKGVGLTCVRSTVRPLGIRPYLCQVDRTTIGAPIPASDQLPASGRSRRRASCPRKRGCDGAFGVIEEANLSLSRESIVTEEDNSSIKGGGKRGEKMKLKDE